MSERAFPEAPTFDVSVLENPAAVIDAVEYMESGLEDDVRKEAAEKFVGWLKTEWENIDGLLGNEPIPVGPASFRFVSPQPNLLIKEDIYYDGHRMDLLRIEVYKCLWLRTPNAKIAFIVHPDQRNELVAVVVSDSTAVSGSKSILRELRINFPVDSTTFTTFEKITEEKSNKFPLRTNIPAQQL